MSDADRREEALERFRRLLVLKKSGLPTPPPSVDKEEIAVIVRGILDDRSDSKWKRATQIATIVAAIALTANLLFAVFGGG